MAQARAAEVEARAVVDARRPQEGQQYEQLDDDPDGRSEAEPGDLSGGEGRVEIGLGDGTVVEEVADQDGDRDQVVGDRRPHHRPEPPARVEDLPDQREHPVEEDLRQAVPREGDDRLALVGQLGVVVVGRQEDVHHPGRGEDQDDGHQAEEQRRERDDAVGVGRAAIGVGLHRPHQLGHQHGVEDPARQQDVEHVRHGVADGEQVGVQEVAQRRREKQRAQVAAEARHHGAGRHHRAGGEQLLLLALRVTRSVGWSVGWGVLGHRAGVIGASGVIGRVRRARARDAARPRPRRRVRRPAAGRRRRRRWVRCRGCAGRRAARSRGTATRPPPP